MKRWSGTISHVNVSTADANWIVPPWSLLARLSARRVGKTMWPYLTPRLLTMVVDHWGKVELGLREIGAWLEPLIATFGPGTCTNRDGGLLPGATDILLCNSECHKSITVEDMEDQLWEWHGTVLQILHNTYTTHEMKYKDMQ
ncbi:hypothetical protein K439DRAFT_378547 [Ramaria rubella]|nr:hypothetical protein K439DRAFT_378547 [Ramaria rubella]